jgi:hypothetical protein
VLWIDFISINQTDNSEKNVQVRMMGRIFSAAKKAVIWLGRPYETDDVWNVEVDIALLQQALVLARRLRVAYETFWCDDPFRWAQYLDEQTKELRLAPASETDHEDRVTTVLINLLG